MNLGGIYSDHGNLDQALSSTLKSLELKGDNPRAVNNLRTFIDQLNLNAANAENSYKHSSYYSNRRTYRTKSYRKYLQVSPNNPESIIIRSDYLDDNQALKTLADTGDSSNPYLNDTSQLEAEGFFTRLRNELLNLAIQEGTTPRQVKS